MGPIRVVYPSRRGWGPALRGPRRRAHGAVAPEGRPPISAKAPICLRQQESIHAQVLYCGSLQGGAAGPGDAMCAIAQQQVQISEAVAWEHDGCCFLTANIGESAPMLSFNGLAARLLGLPLPPDNAVGSLLGSCAMTARVPELDLLRLLLADLHRGQQSAEDGAPRYFRILTRGCGEAVRGVLVCCVERRSFDGCGRLVQVRDRGQDGLGGGERAAAGSDLSRRLKRVRAGPRHRDGRHPESGRGISEGSFFLNSYSPERERARARPGAGRRCTLLTPPALSREEQLLQPGRGWKFPGNPPAPCAASAFSGPPSAPSAPSRPARPAAIGERR